MIQTSEQIDEIAKAVAAAQAELENVEKAGTNPAFRSKYAKLGAVLEEVRPKFAKHGIAIWQFAVNGEGNSVGVVTRLAHSSGQWIESAFYVLPTKADAQGAGSALTYARRYSLMAVAGVAPDDDDDGNAAVGRPPARTNGATRTASAPPLPSNGVNKAALPPGPEETPEVTAARHRIRMLIDKYDNLIKTAPSAHALDLTFEDGRDELAEIEAAGEKGKAAIVQLRDKFMRRIEHLEAAAA